MQLSIKLHEIYGVVRAFHEHTGKEVPIPSFPKPHVDIDAWIGGLSPSTLEAARLYYMDKWIWDSSSGRYRALVERIEAEQHVRSMPQWWC